MKDALPLAKDGFPLSWEVVTIIVVAVLILFTVLTMMISRYKRCPSNRVLVIYGQYTGSPTGTRCLHGGARLVLPLVQDYAYLSLHPIQIEVPSTRTLSADNIRCNRLAGLS